MGIYSEQNILGDPTLSLATRPGSDQKAADYAFNAPMVYRMAEGNFISSFTSPASYSIDKVMAEVTKNNDTGEQTGINDESITFPEAATQYGPAAGNKLADTQRIMAWIAMIVTISAVIVLLTPVVAIDRVATASGFLNTFIVAQLGVVVGFMGATALSKTKPK